MCSLGRSNKQSRAVGVRSGHPIAGNAGRPVLADSVKITLGWMALMKVCREEYSRAGLASASTSAASHIALVQLPLSLASDLIG
jgi:hypothetical protein